ncbi:hypothetical protein [Thermofilum pendens]|uniref:Uncharacterized protein n=1 Tax=Thermofilum pendens (strain DSM 2475 / Hrk 5) TaxID=368408 RepID=A1RYT8_THEPD|nr:hypothetical protein [Thermofilum pendens]ABL78368.1 hypothetical protein Tpen_0968 [Thermofilum pendens Hrk 5]
MAKVELLVECPHCGYSDRLDSFKLLRDPWRYSFYEVRRLQCPKCGGTFNYYYGVSPKGELSTFTIRFKTAQA